MANLKQAEMEGAVKCISYFDQNKIRQKKCTSVPTL